MTSSSFDLTSTLGCEALIEACCTTSTWDWRCHTTCVTQWRRPCHRASTQCTCSKWAGSSDRRCCTTLLLLDCCLLLLLSELVLQMEWVDLKAVELLLKHLRVESLWTSSWHDRRCHSGKRWALQSTCWYEGSSLLMGHLLLLALLSFLLLPH